MCALEQTKTCNTCLKEKPLNKFPSPQKPYRANKCRSCYWEQKTNEQKEKSRQARRDWVSKNREYVRQRNIAYQKKIRERRGTKRKTYPVINGKKECGGCEQILDVKYFYPTKKEDGKIYYSVKCRACTKDHLLNQIGEKQCPRCQKVKPYSDYRPNKEWYDRYCKSCRNEINNEKYRTDRAWREAHKKSTSMSAKKHRTARTKSLKAWKARNQGRVRETRLKYKDKHKENNIRYKKKNIERLRPKLIERNKKYREEIADCYVRTTLRIKKTDNPPPELIELKRTQIKLKRAIASAK